MKNLVAMIVVSMSLVACGGGSGGSDNSSNPGGGDTTNPVIADSRLGTYEAVIINLGTITRSLDIVIEEDDAVASGTPEDLTFFQVRDGDNLFSRYRYMRNRLGGGPTNHLLQSDFESDSAHYQEKMYDSIEDCQDNIAGTANMYSKVLISNVKFTGGGTLHTLVACKLK